MTLNKIKDFDRTAEAGAMRTCIARRAEGASLFAQPRVAAESPLLSKKTVLA